MLPVLCVIKIFFLYLILVSQSLWAHHPQKKPLQQIDPVLALLPWTPQDTPGQQVSFTLKAYGGCFVWTSQRPDFVSVEAIYEPVSKCSTKAVISPTASSFQGGKSWVFARDVASGVELRCEVHVAPIAQIAIDTPARSISVDTVETVTIRATDDRGNVFSSLEGLWFSWSSTNLDVLAFASLDSDVYHASKKRQQIQKLGGETDLVLLKGVSTGSSVVSSRLVSSAYKHVSEATLRLDVSEPLMIEPPILRTIPFSKFSYSLRSLKPQTPLFKSPLIQLPSNHFLWSSSVSELNMKSPCIYIDPSQASVFVNTSKSCETKILVTDQRLSNVVGESVLIISHLSHLKFVYTGKVSTLKTSDGWKYFEESLLRPRSPNPYYPVSMDQEYGETWYFVKGFMYLIGLDGFDKANQLLYLPMNLKIHLKCGSMDGQIRLPNAFGSSKDSCFGLKILHNSPSWQHILVETTSLGEGFLLAELYVGQISTPNGALKETIRVKQSFVITNSVSISFDELSKFSSDAWPQNLVALPIRHEWTFKVKGGSGTYSWSSSNTTVANIFSNKNGDVTLQTQDHLGYTTITIWDSNNTMNRQSFTIVVSSLRYITLDPLREKEPLGQSAEILLRALPAPLQCCNEDCPSNIKIWNKKINTIQFIKDTVVLDNRHLPHALDPFTVHFLNCSGLMSSSLDHLRLSAKTIDAKESLAWRFIENTSAPFVCGHIVVNPLVEPTWIEAHVTLNASWQASAHIEIFSPLSSLVNAPDYPWSPFDPALESSNSNQNRLNISVGSWISFSIQGGPSSNRHYKLSTDVFLAPKVKTAAHVQSVSNISNDFRIFCLDATDKDDGIFTVVREAHPFRAVAPLYDRNAAPLSSQQFNSTGPKQWGIKIPYRSFPIASTVDIRFTCVYPSHIVLQPFRGFVIQQEKRLIADIFPETNEKGSVPVDYAQCDVEHQLGMFLYGSDNTLISFWSSAYRTVWMLNNTVFESDEIASRKIKIIPEKCYGALDVKVSLIFDMASWESAFSKALDNLAGVRELGKRIAKHFTGRKGGSRHLLELKSRLALVRTPPLEIVPSSFSSVHPFFYEPSCFRRLQIRFGSGVYRIHLTNEDKLLIKLGRATLRSTQLPMAPFVKEHSDLDSCSSVNSVVSSCDKDQDLTVALQNSSFPKYFYSIDSLHIPYNSRTTYAYCPGFQDAEFNPLFSHDHDTLVFRKIRQALSAPNHLKFKSPQSFWDIYIQPKQGESSFSFSLIVYDHQLLGTSKVKLNYSFSQLGRLHLIFGQFLYSFQAPSQSLEEKFSLQNSRRPITNVGEVLYADVNDIIELEVEAFDSVYHLEFRPEDIRLMRVCLTASSSQNDVQLSCVGEYPFKGVETGLEDKFWNYILENSKKKSDEKQKASAAISAYAKPVVWFQARQRGIYALQVTGHNLRGLPILSNVLRVVVSDPLIFFPSSLLLLPGYHTYEIITRGERDSQTVEKSLQLFVLGEKGSAHKKARDIISIEWIEGATQHQHSDSTPFSILEIRTSRSCGRVRVCVMEKDAASPIVREASVDITVAIPDALRIGTNDHLDGKKMIIPVMKLRTSNSRSLKAILTLNDGTPFTAAHHWLTSAYKANVSVLEVYGCHYTWSTNRSDLLRFLTDDVVRSSKEVKDNRYTGFYGLEGPGLFFVQVLALPVMLENQVDALVRVACSCTFPSDVVPSKNNSPAISRHYDTQIQVQIVPQSQAFVHPVFSEFFDNKFLSVNPFMDRFYSQIQVLRLVSFGEYHIKLAKAFVGVDVKVLPPSSTYPLVDVNFSSKANILSIKVLVESIERHKVFLYLKRHMEWSHDDSIVSLDVLRPASLSIIPTSIYTSIGSTVYLYPLLRDEMGSALLFPFNIQITSQVSHPSVFREKEVVNYAESSFKSPYIEGVISRLGCTGIIVSLRHLALKMKQLSSISAGARLCAVASVYPSSAWVLSGGDVHSLLHSTVHSPESLKPEFQLRVLLKSSVIPWVWLAYGSSSCVSELEFVLKEYERKSLKIHANIFKWLYHSQPFLKDPSCRKVTRDMLKSWVRHRLDEILLTLIQQHVDGTIERNAELSVLSEISLKNNRRATVPLSEQVVFSYTLALTSHTAVHPNTYLEWIVSKVSVIVKELFNPSIEHDLIQALLSHTAWQEGGIIFLNSRKNLDAVEWSVQRIASSAATSTTSVSSSLKPLSDFTLYPHNAELSTSGILGSFVATIKRPQAFGKLDLHVVSKVHSACVFLRRNITDIQSFDVHELQRKDHPNHEDMRCSNSETTVTHFSETLNLQKAPFDIVILPYGSAYAVPNELLVSTPFVSQKITVFCHIRSGPFFDVTPVYGIPVSLSSFPFQTTVGCRFFPRLHKVITPESHLLLGIKLEGVTSITSYFEFVWPLGWNLVIQPNPKYFVLFKNLPYVIQQFILQFSKKNTNPPFHAIQVMSNSRQPVTFKVLTAGQCLVQAKVDHQSKWTVKEVTLSPNITEVQLSPLTSETDRKSDLFERFKSSLTSEETNHYVDIALLAIRCGVYETQLPVFLTRSSLASYTIHSLFTRYLHYAFFFSKFFLKFIFSFAFIVTATWIYYFRKNRANLPRRSTLGFTSLAQRSMPNIGTPYRQPWSHNRGIGIGGYSAHSPSSVCASTSRRSIEPFT